MTKTQCNKKINEMIRNMIPYLKKDCKRLFDCGGVDTGKYEDNYLLPRIILCSALKNQSFQYLPLDGASKKEVENLKHF